jgi:hypothetical protein
VKPNSVPIKFRDQPFDALDFRLVGKRPLRTGAEADVYEATLLAIAETGPKSALNYDEMRSKLNVILADKVPQKHEVTSALKHLSRISAEAGGDMGIDWDDGKRMLHITDPYLRFYLRWQVRQSAMPKTLLINVDAAPKG